MTEEEWLSCEKQHEIWMQYPRAARKSQRKFRLFAVACCRLVWGHLTDFRSRRAVEVSERFADGQASLEELSEAHESIAGVRRYSPNALVRSVSELHPNFGISYIANRIANGNSYLSPSPHERHQLAILRDIFGNPFRPAALDPRWRTTDVLDLARAIYEDRAFDRMPILADALMDAGCDSADVIGHCRGGGPHVRGCWVVDLILGKE